MIALHGTEENSEKLDALTEEEYMARIEYPACGAAFV